MSTSTATIEQPAATRRAETIICCEQLTKRYPGDILAVDRLDLAVFPGEVFGLLGPNGAASSLEFRLRPG